MNGRAPEMCPTEGGLDRIRKFLGSCPLVCSRGAMAAPLACVLAVFATVSLLAPATAAAQTRSLELYFTHTKAWKPKGANRMFFSSSEIDRLADLAHTTTDQEKRKEYVVQWMAQLLEEAPVIYLPTIHLTLGSRNYVHGDRILATDNYPATEAWIDQEAKSAQGIDR